MADLSIDFQIYGIFFIPIPEYLDFGMKNAGERESVRRRFIPYRK